MDDEPSEQSQSSEKPPLFQPEDKIALGVLVLAAVLFAVWLWWL